MIIPDIEKLYAPYSKTASLNDTLVWLRRQAAGLKIESDTVDEAISSVFMEMARGKTFNVDGSKFGFGKEHAHAHLNHYLLDKCRQLNAEKVSIYLKLHQERLNSIILKHIEAENMRYMAEYEETLPPVTPTTPSATTETVKVKKTREVKKVVELKNRVLREFSILVDWSKSPVLRRIGWTGSR